MKKSIVATLALLLGLYFVAGADVVKRPAVQSNPTFERVKSLSGNWEYEMPGGRAVKAFYQPIANGTCVMATLDLPGDTTMTTIYHMDGNRIVLDNYSWLNNVPHMKATLSPDGNQLSFTLVSSTNLASPTAAHVHSLKITFVDDDHFNEEWTVRSGGKVRSMVYHFQHED